MEISRLSIWAAAGARDGARVLRGLLMLGMAIDMDICQTRSKLEESNIRARLVRAAATLPPTTVASAARQQLWIGTSRTAHRNQARRRQLLSIIPVHTRPTPTCRINSNESIKIVESQAR
ncbi:hypothetical protein JHW43_000525 [Diplocarpon mali]|nr:hypothetical protein JHW43_000525 [Diplocarpon mali]